MACVCDIADNCSAPLLDAGVKAIREEAARMVAGEPGECEMCGEHSLRLVDGVYAPCRDKHHLP